MVGSGVMQNFSILLNRFDRFTTIGEKDCPLEIILEVLDFLTDFSHFIDPKAKKENQNAINTFIESNIIMRLIKLMQSTLSHLQNFVDEIQYSQRMNCSKSFYEMIDKTTF